MSYMANNSLIVATIGVTVGVIGAAGIFLYQYFVEKQQYKVRNHKLEVVNQRINDLQAELDTLRQQQNQLRRKRRSTVANKRKGLNSNDSTYASTDNDAYSTAATDIGDDEFFDCSDSEGAIGDTLSRDSESINELEELFIKIDAQEEVEEEITENTYNTLRNLIKLHPNNVGLIWRFARACYNHLNNSSDIEYKKQLINEGLEACQQVICIEDADLHKWCAILSSLYGEYLPVAERIKNGYLFKNHVMKALEIRPTDPYLHHLLGRFKYEVSNLTWFERTIAATFFSEPPNATYEDAIESFEQAEQYATKPHLENRLFLSKTYIAMSAYDKAVHWLNDICERSVTNKEDQNIQSEAKKLLQTYSSYV